MIRWARLVGILLILRLFIERKNAEIERLRLTDEERDAINWSAELACADDNDEYALRKAWVLQSLLERTKN